MHNAMILGVPRSGTSLAASLFRDAGYFMGNKPLPPSESNPKGYFEDEAVNQLNNQLLRQLGIVPKRLPLRKTAKLLKLFGINKPQLDYRSWAHQTPRYPVKGDPTPAMAEQMKGLVAQTPFCYKDPRFTYTLKQWMGVTPDNTRFLVVFRSPVDTVVSMLKNTRIYTPPVQLSPRFCERVWSVNYAYLLESYSGDSRFMFVHYDQILNNQATGKIAEFFEADLVNDLADPGLARSRRNDLKSEITPLKQTTDLYERLCGFVDYKAEAREGEEA